ncbi:GroES-like protein [Coprinellus micaceus]|uniref:GroES-like protein n=1 Tax=Coprinellus micaceus TaxID=71717 RepID=A0A4Y7TH16_COPMI|nr:GroES-like protein [Coprinellus micaceus]
MSSQTQKALILNKKQGDFVISTVPVPKPGKDEVLVKIVSSALNPVDWKIQKYGWWVEEYPSYLWNRHRWRSCRARRECLEICRWGPSGSYGQNEQNGFQQFAIADAHTTAKIPPNVSSDEASTIPVAFTAAYVGLYNVKPHGMGFDTPVHTGARGKYKDTPIVILGGASSLGQYAIQLAALSGFSPIITTASLKHEEYLKSLGATVVLDRHVPPSKESFQQFSEKPIETVLDAISSAQTHEDSLRIIGYAGERAEKQGTGAYHVLGLKTLPFHVQILREFWDSRNRTSGEWQHQEVLPNGLEGIPEGLERLYENKVSGVKLVARPQESGLNTFASWLSVYVHKYLHDVT